MAHLLDTHALIWWWLDMPQLGSNARDILRRGESVIYVSAVSALEIAIKWRVGKLREIPEPEKQYGPLMSANGFLDLVVSRNHSLMAGLLEGDHRDPFDRLIAAQALIEGLTVVTRDPQFARFGCEVIW